MNWSERESRDYLNWSLEGKALHFFTVTTEMGEHYSFRKIMKKLESRFGAKELTETSRAEFQQAKQYYDESLEDWADRVLTLATTAFRNLPDSHRKQEAIAKFCQGCLDRDAGKHACFEHPKNMQAALNAVKHYQYISQAVDGKKSRKQKDDVSVNMVTPTPADLEKMMEKVVKKLMIQTQTTDAAKSKETPTHPGMQCFFCKKFGHVKKNCRKYLARSQSQRTNNSQNKDLNGKGLNGRATHYSPRSK